MSNSNCKKPEWYKKPEEFNFKVINEPLERIYSYIKLRLDKDRNQSKFNFLLFGFLKISFQTYNAIHKLVATNPKYPFQARVLVRELIDILFTIVAIVENPGENSNKYEKAGYRNLWERYELEKNKYGNDPEWNSWFKTKKENLLDPLAKTLNLTEEEKNNPVKAIMRWPNPNRMLSKSEISLHPDKIKFLKEIETWLYGELSEWSHMGWGGLAMGLFSDMPETHWTPGKVESDAVVSGILILLMILSEITISCGYGKIQELRYVWTILNNYFDEAKDYYNLRYDNLLKVDDK